MRHTLPGLLALTVACFMAVTTEMLPVGLLPAIGSTFGVGDSVTGLLVSVYAVMVAVLAVPLTLATRRAARKTLLLATVTCYALSNLLVTLAPGFALVVAGRALGGVTHALFFSVAIGYVSRLVDRAYVGRALALVTGGVSAGFVLGVPLATSLGTAVGWRVAFGALAAVTGAAAVVVAIVLPPVPNTVPAPAHGEAGRRRQLTAVVGANGLSFLGQYSLYTYITVLLLGSGAGKEAIGPILVLCGLAGLVGLWLAARRLDHNPRLVGVAVLAVALAGMAGVGLAYPSLALVIVAAMAWNGAFGAVPSVYQSAAIRTHAVAPEMAGAWVNATSNVGIAAGAAIGAALLAGPGLRPIVWTGCAILATALLLVVAARRAFPRKP
ncbi:MFS transporter [Specibacter cremeus]|uniref:MFS transporter n=1 Tax=Specibacter cremeus TaxID=1629051 RepID=UPI00197C643D|nr:MFS transporter [Specibacter cremeus]